MVFLIHTDIREVCGLPKHRLLCDQPSAIVWVVSHCHVPSATHRGCWLSGAIIVFRWIIWRCSSLRSCSFCDRWMSVRCQWKGNGAETVPVLTWEPRGLCSTKPSLAWSENANWQTVSAVCFAGRIINAHAFMVFVMWVVMKYWQRKYEWINATFSTFRCYKLNISSKSCV